MEQVDHELHEMSRTLHGMQGDLAVQVVTECTQAPDTHVHPTRHPTRGSCVAFLRFANRIQRSNLQIMCHVFLLCAHFGAQMQKINENLARLFEKVDPLWHALCAFVSLHPCGQCARMRTSMRWQTISRGLISLHAWTGWGKLKEWQEDPLVLPSR